MIIKNSDFKCQKQVHDVPSNENYLAGIREIQVRIAELPIVDSRPGDEI